MQNHKIIDLGIARTSPQAIVFAGRERGKYWRLKFGLDDLDGDEQPVDVLIPQDVISLNISFFLNLFGASVRKLGSDGFREHYVFKNDPVLDPSISQGIEQALKRSIALPD
jgi:hypothetical protein